MYDEEQQAGPSSVRRQPPRSARPAFPTPENDLGEDAEDVQEPQCKRRHVRSLKDEELYVTSSSDDESSDAPVYEAECGLRPFTVEILLDRDTYTFMEVTVHKPHRSPTITVSAPTITVSAPTTTVSAPSTTVSALPTTVSAIPALGRSSGCSSSSASAPIAAIEVPCVASATPLGSYGTRDGQLTYCGEPVHEATTACQSEACIVREHLEFLPVYQDCFICMRCPSAPFIATSQLADHLYEKHHSLSNGGEHTIFVGRTKAQRRPAINAVVEHLQVVYPDCLQQEQEVDEFLASIHSIDSPLPPARILAQYNIQRFSKCKAKSCPQPWRVYGCPKSRQNASGLGTDASELYPLSEHIRQDHKGQGVDNPKLAPETYDVRYGVRLGSNNAIKTFVFAKSFVPVLVNDPSRTTQPLPETSASLPPTSESPIVDPLMVKLIGALMEDNLQWDKWMRVVEQFVPRIAWYWLGSSLSSALANPNITLGERVLTDGMKPIIPKATEWLKEANDVLGTCSTRVRMAVAVRSSE